MLYYLQFLAQYSESLSFLRLFRYLTVRAGGAALTAFLVVVLLGPPTVRWLNSLNLWAPDRLKEVEGAEEAVKRKPPSMGGLLILLAIVAATLLWTDLWRSLVQVFLVLILSYGLIGLYDDWLKVRNRSSSQALSESAKLVAEIAVAVLAVWWLDSVPETKGQMRNLMVPFLKDPLWTDMPAVVAIAFGAFVVVGTANAVNLTDGMDGLATGCTFMVALTYGVLAYLTGHVLFSHYLQVPYIRDSGEAMVIAAAMAGAALGFLWHNCFPAAVYMGDTGSLSQGAGIGLLAVLVRQELLLVLVGGIFVLEAGSVIVQRSWFKYTKRKYGAGRRIFRCAPFHHHLEKGGWERTQVVIRFWIVGIALAGLGLASLKLR